MARSVIDTCSPVERRRSSSRAGGFVLSVFASPTSSSVVFPIAETTATTSSPAFFLAMSLFATILIRSGDATDVPPNLHTTNDISIFLLKGKPLRHYTKRLGIHSRAVHERAIFHAEYTKPHVARGKHAIPI